MANDAWRSDALCGTETFKALAWQAGAERDPALIFFPVECDSNGQEFKKGKPKFYRLMEARFERLARATCAACPVREDCLFWTMEQEVEPWGIAGGLDAENRKALLVADNPVIEQKTCTCGITIYGAKGSTPKACSANCKGKK